MSISSRSSSKKLNGKTFIQLDFYQCRGIANIMMSRTGLSKKEISRRATNTPMAKFCKALRHRRDAVFKNTVLGKAEKKDNSRWTVKPKKNREMRAIASQLDIIQVEMPHVPSIAEPCTITCLCSDERANRHSKLWVENMESMWRYIAKVVAHEYATTNNGDDDSCDGASAVDDVRSNDCQDDDTLDNQSGCDGSRDEPSHEPISTFEQVCESIVEGVAPTATPSGSVGMSIMTQPTLARFFRKS